MLGRISCTRLAGKEANFKFWLWSKRSHLVNDDVSPQKVWRLNCCGSLASRVVADPKKP